MFDRLKSLPVSAWTPEDPGKPSDLLNIEKRFNLKLPADFIDFILYSNGGEIGIDGSVLHLEPADLLVGHNLSENFQKLLPGMLVIGDDAGGSIYFYDPHNRFGHGENAIFLVPMGTLQPRDAIFVGKNLTAVIESVLSSENFHRRPPHGKDL